MVQVEDSRLVQKVTNQLATLYVIFLRKNYIFFTYCEHFIYLLLLMYSFVVTVAYLITILSVLRVEVNAVHLLHDDLYDLTACRRLRFLAQHLAQCIAQNIVYTFSAIIK